MQGFPWDKYRGGVPVEPYDFLTDPYQKPKQVFVVFEGGSTAEIQMDILKIRNQGGEVMVPVRVIHDLINYANLLGVWTPPGEE